MVSDADEDLDVPQSAFRQATLDAMEAMTTNLRSRGVTWSLLTAQAVKQRFLTPDEVDLASTFLTGTSITSDFEMKDLSETAWMFLGAFLRDFDDMTVLHQTDWLSCMNSPTIQLRSQIQENQFLRFPYRTLSGHAPIGFDRAESTTLVTPLTNLSMRPTEDGHNSLRARIAQVISEPADLDPKRMAWASDQDSWSAKVCKLGDETNFIITRGKIS